MSRSTQRLLIVIAAVIGAILPLRPLFFGRADPAAETIDLVISPVYILWRLLPPMGDLGSLIVLAVALTINAALYGAIAYFLLRKFKQPGAPTLTQQQRVDP